MNRNLLFASDYRPDGRAKPADRRGPTAADSNASEIVPPAPERVQPVVMRRGAWRDRLALMIPDDLGAVLAGAVAAALAFAYAYAAGSNWVCALLAVVLAGASPLPLLFRLLQDARSAERRMMRLADWRKSEIAATRQLARERQEEVRRVSADSLMWLRVANHRAASIEALERQIAELTATIHGQSLTLDLIESGGLCPGVDPACCKVAVQAALLADPRDQAGASA